METTKHMKAITMMKLEPSSFLDCHRMLNKGSSAFFLGRIKVPEKRQSVTDDQFIIHPSGYKVLAQTLRVF